MSVKGNKWAVLGSGSWATALVKILSDNVVEKEISWWLRSEETADFIRNNRHNPKYLTSVEIHSENIHIDSDIKTVIDDADFVLIVVPSAFLGEVFFQIPEEWFRGKKIISAVKGLIPETGQIVGEYLQDQYKMPLENIAVITGPCHAEEVALERLSYLTVASDSLSLTGQISGMIKNRYIRTTESDDIYGTEYAAVLKNIYAITAGICHGLGFGDNFQAVLMSNAIREIKRFIDTAHPISRDIDDSAYLGDLLVTGYSQFSRNRTFGNMLGKGYPVKSAQLEMNMIAEGYYATRSIYEMNLHYEVDMPILAFTWQVVYGGQAPVAVIDTLLKRLN